jgi:hypothetical protein
VRDQRGEIISALAAIDPVLPVTTGRYGAVKKLLVRARPFERE